MSDIPQLPPAIELTDTAAEMVLEAMADEGLSVGDNYLRVGVMGGGCSGLQYLLDFTDSPSDYDQTFEQHGVKVAVDYFSAAHLMGTVVNYVDTLNGSGFKFENPNIVRRCGCGSSFAT